MGFSAPGDGTRFARQRPMLDGVPTSTRTLTALAQLGRRDPSSAAGRAVVEGERDAAGLRQGWYRYYSSTGELVGRAHYRDDLLDGQVITLHRGERVAELSYRAGLPHGPYRRVVHEGTYASIAGTSPAWEEGSFDGGLSCGVLRLRDAAGNVLLERELGDVTEDDDLFRSVVHGEGHATPETWARYARELVERGRVADGLAAMARSVGAGGKPHGFVDWLRHLAAPVTPEEAVRRASAVRASGSPRVLVNALVRGAEPPPVLRRLAVLTRGEPSPSFLLASVALREWPLSPILARAIRDVEVGDPRSVIADAKVLMPTHTEDARVLAVLAARRRRQVQAPMPEHEERPTVKRSIVLSA